MIGGLLIAAGISVLAGLIGWLPPGFRLLAFLLVVALGGVVETGVSAWTPPQRKKMIPPDRFEMGIRGGLFVFGIELGLGFRTYIPHVGPFLLAAFVLFLTPGWVGVILLALGWAMGRGLIVLLRIVIGGSPDLDGGFDQLPKVDSIAATMASRATAGQLLVGPVLAMVLYSL